jgi:CubicO group peptidase (beta-lactamase class C family)
MAETTGIPTAADEGVMQGFPAERDRRVTFENWQLPPFNRWSFHHVSEILRTARVPRDGARRWELPVAANAPDLEAVSFELSDGRTSTIGEWLPSSYTDGMLVLHDGAIALERYQNGMRPESLHLSMSVGKSMTSLLTGILVERGLVGLDTPVTEYVPEIDGSGYAGATVQHLLDMAVALDYVEDYTDPEREFWKMDYACGFGPDRGGASADCIIDLLKTFRGVDRPHGEVFLYCSLDTDLLGIICERATGTRFPDLFAREVWGPLGAEWDADIALDPAGTAVVDGGFDAALRDYGRIGQLVLDGGVANGRQVVPAVWIEECWRPNRDPFLRSAAAEQFPDGSYHDKWWQHGGRLHAWGIHGQWISIHRESRTVAVILSSEPEPDNEAHLRTQTAVLEAITRPF